MVMSEVLFEIPLKAICSHLGLEFYGDSSFVPRNLSTDTRTLQDNDFFPDLEIVYPFKHAHCKRAKNNATGQDPNVFEKTAPAEPERRREGGLHREGRAQIPRVRSFPQCVHGGGSCKTMTGFLKGYRTSWMRRWRWRVFFPPAKKPSFRTGRTLLRSSIF